MFAAWAYPCGDRQDSCRWRYIPPVSHRLRCDVVGRPSPVAGMLRHPDERLGVAHQPVSCTFPSELASEHPSLDHLGFVEVVDEMVSWDAFQDVERPQSRRCQTVQPHDDALGTLCQGSVYQLLHHQGSAIVHIDGICEVEDNQLVFLDVHTDGADHLGCQCRGKSASKPRPRRAKQAGVAQGESLGGNPAFSVTEAQPIQ